MVRLSHDGDAEQARAIFRGASRDSFNKMGAVLTDMVDFGEEHAAAAVIDGRQAYERSRYMTIGALALSLSIGLASAFIAFKRIAKPVTRITASMNDLASGALENPIPYIERKDEIGIWPQPSPCWTDF